MMPRGGARKGAGRPKGAGKYGEPTQAIRIPKRLIPEVSRLARAGDYRLPLYASRVAAGFPSPADDYMEGKLDLNAHLVRHPAATFFVRATGESMLGAGIHPGDLLVVDRSLTPQDGKVVIAAVNGELTVKRLRRRGGQVELVPENEAYPVITLSQDEDMIIWGVVTAVVHDL